MNQTCLLNDTGGHDHNRKGAISNRNRHHGKQMTQLTQLDKIQLIHQLTKMNDAVNPANFEPKLPPPTHGPGSRIEQLQLGLESTELIHNN